MEGGEREKDKERKGGQEEETGGQGYRGRKR